VHDFTLDAADTGTVLGEIEIVGGTDEQHVTLSFRQAADCSPVILGVDEQIELRSLNVANFGSYIVRLPVGDNTLVASTYGKATKNPNTVSVKSNIDIPIDKIIF
jgi:hypothetical protein